jgi:hypothetical protein
MQLAFSKPFQFPPSWQSPLMGSSDEKPCQLVNTDQSIARNAKIAKIQIEKLQNSNSSEATFGGFR